VLVEIELNITDGVGMFGNIVLQVDKVWIKEKSLKFRIWKKYNYW
jgi:hypothetical protein